MNSDDPLTAIDRLAESFVDMAGASAFDTDLESSDEALTELLSTTFATPVSSGHGSDDLDSLSASSAGDPSQVKGEHIVRQPTRPLIRTPAAEATHTASPSLAPPLEPTPPPPSPAAYLITLASYGVQLVPTGPKHAAALPEVYDRQVTTVAESLSSVSAQSHFPNIMESVLPCTSSSHGHKFLLSPHAARLTITSLAPNPPLAHSPPTQAGMAAIRISDQPWRWLMPIVSCTTCLQLMLELRLTRLMRHSCPASWLL